MLHELIEKLDPMPKPNLPFPRCQHRSPAGRQCSQPICSTSPQFCLTHKPKPEDLLIAELTAAAGALSTPEEIHNFLTKVTLLRVQGRITPKESCSYAYLCQILQRGQREIAYHQKLREERAEREAEAHRHSNSLSTLWKIPRPDRDDPSDPPASAPSTSPTPVPAESPAAVSTTRASLDEHSPVVGDELAHPSSPTAAIAPPPTSAATLVPAEGGSSLCHPDWSSGALPLRSGGTVATNTTLTHLDGTSAPSPEKPADKKSPRKSSSAAASAPPKPLPPDFHNHFYPIDLTLPPGSQDLTKNIPHPDAAECARRNARRGLDFKRRPSLFTFWRGVPQRKGG